MENYRLSDQNLRRNEHDSNGIATGEGKLTLNGGTIRQAVTDVAEDLSHDPVTPKVDQPHEGVSHA